MRGFTLVEILVVLLIVSILSGAALYYNSDSYSQSKLQIKSDELLHHLKYARAQAIQKNQRVGLCGMQDAQTCGPSWEMGYLIFTPKEILHVQAHVDKSIIVTGQFNHSDNTIQFMPTGQARDTGRVTLSSKNATLNKTIFVSLAGRARVE
jgi:prepilin-type N-terminal cleavage/methylation domain-containing protein